MDNTYDDMGSGNLIVRIISRLSALSGEELREFIVCTKGLGFDPDVSMYRDPAAKSNGQEKALLDLV